ncbi:hypothetical protein O59_003760 [Cellvibrio sp. BR]|nr:hypothetical protein O59_003760 [Cellvibrio sp. BR]
MRFLLEQSKSNSCQTDHTEPIIVKTIFAGQPNPDQRGQPA